MSVLFRRSICLTTSDQTRNEYLERAVGKASAWKVLSILEGTGALGQLGRGGACMGGETQPLDCGRILEMHIVTQLSKPKRFALQLHFHALPPRHKKERSTLRAVQFYTAPACLPPNTNCIALEERPKYSDQQPAALKGVHPHAWVQGTDSWEGFKALWGNVLLQVVAPCHASNKVRTTILEIFDCTL